MLKGLIWDVDGTLCDTLPLCLTAFRAVFRRHLGRDLDDSEIVAGFGATEAGTIRVLISEQWEAAEREYLHVYSGLHDELASMFPGVVDTLRYLDAGGIKQAVVTGKGAESARITLERFQLSGFFDAVETGSSEGPVKPERIGRVLRRWGFELTEVAYVGDTPYDIASAAEVGIPGVLAKWCKTSGGMLAAHVTPALTAASPAEVAAWCMRGRAS